MEASFRWWPPQLDAGNLPANIDDLWPDDLPIRGWPDFPSDSHQGNTASASVPASSSSSSSVKVPTTVRQAMDSPDRVQWQEALHTELKNLAGHNTWSLVELPPGIQPLPCRWVFAHKLSTAGEIVEYKARLVIKGFHQRPGVDFTEVESPVATLDTVRSLLAFAAANRLPLGQMDVSGAFLNGTLDEEIYMQQPPGFADPDRPAAVCKLIKALYGLKQAALAWFTTLKSFMTTHGFSTSPADPCLFTRGSLGTVDFMAIAVWVDDLLVVGASKKSIRRFYETLTAIYPAKYLGSPDLFVGIHISQDPTTFAVTLDQSHYIAQLCDDFLEKDTTFKVGSTSSPFNRGFHLDFASPSPPFSDVTLYQSLVGALLWLARCTRPDIAFAVGWLGRASHAPTRAHWHEALQTLAYLQATHFLALNYTAGPASLHGFSDADYGESASRKSTTGTVFFLRDGDSPILWKSKLQPIVTRSSTEAEYVAVSDSALEATWLGYLFNNLGTESFPVPLGLDNASAGAIIASPIQRQKTKHIDIRYHYVRDRAALGFLDIVSVPGTANPADVCTKAYTPAAFCRARSFLNLVPV